MIFKDSRAFVYPATIFFAVIVILSCSGNGVSTTASLVFPDSLISYRLNVEPFLNVKCAYSTCHSEVDRKGGRSFATYNSLIFDAANSGLIVAGHPESSLLIQYLNGTFPHTNPYFPQNYINSNQINGMKKWILEGALNN